MLNLNINFLADGITVELRNEFMSAVCFETASVTVQMLDSEISRLNTQISNLQSNTNKSEEEKKVGLDSLNQKLTEKEEEKSKAEAECDLYRPSYDKVITTMSLKNADHFGNSKDVVRTVLRVLGALDNSKLMKYAIIPAFQSPALYEALEAIHMNSKASEDGMVIASKEVKDAYKKASQELETIIKTTFSLPFETVYTSKTRVKLTAEDKKLLNDCYIKGFRNKFLTDDTTGKVSFEKRQIKTLVKGKINKKTRQMEYDYSGLASTICDIVVKHYFA